MASRQRLLPDWWGTKHTILSAGVGVLVIVGIIVAVHFSGNADEQDTAGTWSDVDVRQFVSAEVEAGRFPGSAKNLVLKARTKFPCVDPLQYVSTNIITMEKVDLQFAKIQTLTPAESSPGRWNPLVKCDVIKNHENIFSQVDKYGDPHGVGIDNTDKGNRYSGQYDNCEFSGIGEYVWKNDNVYLGQWTAGNFHGEGTYTVNATGKSYSGEWVNDKMKGMVTITSTDGTSRQACSDISHPPFKNFCDSV
eukprot:57403_1